MSIRLEGVTRMKWQLSEMRSRAIILALAGALALSACGSEPDLGAPGYVQGFAGGVVADEPQAALIGRDVLAAGGSAGDAAAATFFALAVTKPASAGLASHGYCLDYNVKDQTQQAYRFGSPAAVRAMAAIHARLGILPWRQAVGPAEALARFGYKLSLAFAADWQAAGPDDPAARALFGAGTVGTEVQELDLAGLLGQIRGQGAGSFYSGAAAQTVWQAAAAAGLRINETLWRDAVAEAQPVATQPLGNHTLAHLPFPAQSGVDSAGATSAGAAQTSIAVVDRFGNAVACVYGMGRPFGIGRLTAGLFLAAPGGPSADTVLVTNPNTKILLAALAGGAGRGVLERMAEQTISGDTPLGSALAANGAVNAIVCRGGLPNYPESCSAGTDPNGNGLAAIAEPGR
ncbi:MAG: gamma-glutamyltransferase [Alphaproteobacteria bacterium]|nr:gamma-glutamyltransferase [Alphaproteobacteria bacterium]MCB9929353.1 gamma-glutamyltransferase [Alphaproteobacteria bacterium]